MNVATARKRPGPIPHARVLERLAISEKIPLIVERQPDGKMRVTSGSWDGEKVFFRDQVLEVRAVEGRLHIARKEKSPDEWDPPVVPYDPYGPGSAGSDEILEI